MSTNQGPLPKGRCVPSSALLDMCVSKGNRFGSCLFTPSRGREETLSLPLILTSGVLETP